MMDERRKQLLKLGPEKLADALLEMAAGTTRGEQVVQRLTSKPQASLQAIKARIDRYKQRQGYIPWAQSSDFAREVSTVIEDIRSVVKDPKTGLELVCSFFETDQGIFESCDDSSGYLGMVYRDDAQKLFVEFARRCLDKQWVADLVIRLNEKDSYGVRDCLFDCMDEYLPTKVLKTLVERFWEQSQKENEPDQGRRWLFRIESLAKQLRDGPLFEKTRKISWGKLNEKALLEIAEVYLESGDVKAALSWAEQGPDTDTFHRSDRDKLLEKIFKKSGDREKQAEVAWRIFQGYRSKESLKELLAVIGKGKRNEVIDQETKSILSDSRLSESDAEFLLGHGRIDEAEEYLLKRAEQLNGNDYHTLLTLADVLEKKKRFLVTSLLHRALLESILKRAKSKYYHHGIRYFKKLEMLAGRVPSWNGFLSHEAYASALRRDHARKSSFWAGLDE